MQHYVKGEAIGCELQQLVFRLNKGSFQLSPGFQNNILPLRTTSTFDLPTQLFRIGFD
jgi:hypothetical protein